MKIKKSVSFSILLIVFCLLWNCKPDFKANSSANEKLKIYRFEEDLFSISVYGLKDSISFLEEKYPKFFPLFTYKIIEIGGPGDAGFEANLLAFTTDFTLYRVSKHIAELFPDLSLYENELGMAFKRYKNLFPAKPIPKVVSCISGFNQSVITSDSLLTICLDKYLGPEDEFYKLMYPPVPDYMRGVMRPEKIVPDALQAWVITEFPFTNSKDNLLARMIYQGRSLYCVEQLIPEIHDTLLWGYSGEQMDFCVDNELRMWEYLVENKKLFISDGFTIAQFVNEAPFTKEFSQESPGKAVVWLGYKIVQSFVRHNKDVTLQQLMEEKDYQKILNLSKYNP